MIEAPWALYQILVIAVDIGLYSQEIAIFGDFFHESLNFELILILHFLNSH